MQIIKVDDRSAILIDRLEIVWKDAVKKTHLFLSDDEINNIQKYVPQALMEIENLIIGVDDKGEPVAFMGVAQQKIEMLFVAPQAFGQGFGSALVEYAISEYSVNQVGVNEQNPQAKGFYEHMGFKVYKRTETDEQGMPYPILYMKL